MLEYWGIGLMDCWNNADLVPPIIHYSIIPVNSYQIIVLTLCAFVPLCLGASVPWCLSHSIPLHFILQLFIKQLSGAEQVGFYRAEGLTNFFGYLLIAFFLHMPQLDDDPVFLG